MTTDTTAVLDTCVLVSRPDAINEFAPAEVMIPLRVVEELDGLKGRQDDVGWAARESLRRIEALRADTGGSLEEPVALPGGGTLRVQANGLHLDQLIAHGFDIDKADNRILGSALGVAARQPGRSVVMVSNDAAMRIKAAHVGLVAISHGAVPEPAFSDGWTTVTVPADMVGALHDGQTLDAADVAAAAGLEAVPPTNTYLVCVAGQQSALARVHSDGVRVLRDSGRPIYGLRPRSKEQRFALDLLMDPTVKVVAITGRAGTGKTVLSMAAGLEQTAEAKPTYQQIGVFRPIVPVGVHDLGFLPGTLEEKLDVWTGPVMDNLQALTSDQTVESATVLREELEARNQLVFGSLAHVRGRSMTGLWCHLDEGQNIERIAMKTLMSRMGDGSKIVITGDVEQIDSPYLDRRSNGLSAVIEAFEGHPVFGHVHLSKGERSDVADLAADRL